MATDAWDPTQYERFKSERTAPFIDLLSLVQVRSPARVVDLGCGTGELTALMAERLGAGDVLGIDRSPAMLERAAAHADGRLRFEQGDIADFDGPEADLVVANASLQWLPDHRAALSRWASALGPGGELAVQVPANVDHPSHTSAVDVAGEAPFAEAFGDWSPADPVRSVLSPAAYAELLYELGFGEQHVRLQVYGHVLESTDEVVEWLKGTSLTRFAARLSDDLYDQFVERYRARVVAALGRRSPYFYAFQRIVFWGRRTISP